MADGTHHGPDVRRRSGHGDGLPRGAARPAARLPGRDRRGRSRSMSRTATGRTGRRTGARRGCEPSRVAGRWPEIGRHRPTGGTRHRAQGTAHRNAAQGTGGTTGEVQGEDRRRTVARLRTFEGDRAGRSRSIDRTRHRARAARPARCRARTRDRPKRRERGRRGAHGCGTAGRADGQAHHGPHVWPEIGHAARRCRPSEVTGRTSLRRGLPRTWTATGARLPCCRTCGRAKRNTGGTLAGRVTKKDFFSRLKKLLKKGRGISVVLFATIKRKKYH